MCFFGFFFWVWVVHPYLVRYALASLPVYRSQGLVLAQVEAVPPALGQLLAAAATAVAAAAPVVLLVLFQLLCLALLQPAAVVEHLPPRAKVNVLPPQDVDQVNVL